MPSFTDAVAALVFVAVGTFAVLLRRQGQRIDQNQETNMAQFDSLNEDVAAVKAEVGSLADRIEAAVAAANDDTADQAAIDAADADLRGALEAMRALAQAPAPAPVEEPPAPAEPTF